MSRLPSTGTRGGSRRLAVFGVVTTSLLAVTARAEPPAASGVAEVLFEQARSDMRRGAFTDAYPKLAESERIDPSSGTLLNLALCEERLGKVASAWLHARELADRLERNDMRKPIADRMIAGLLPRVPKLIVHVARTAPPDIEVALDGVPLGRSSLDVELPVDPGAHRVVATAEKRTAQATAISLEEAQSYELTVEPGPPAAPQASSYDPARSDVLAAPIAGSGSPQPATSVPLQASGMDTSKGLARVGDEGRMRASAHSATWPAWTAVGVGAAALAAGAVLGALTLRKQSEVEAECPGKACTDSKGLSDASAGRTLFAGTVAALAAGTVGVGIGVYLLAGSRASGPAATASSPFTGAALRYSASF